MPALLLLVVQVLFAGNFTFFRQNLYLFPAITLFSFVYSLTVAFAMLALSSLSQSSRFVGILYAAVIFLSQAIYGVLYGITRDSSVAWMSVTANLSQLAAFIFRLPLPYDVPWPVSLTIILGVAGAAAAVLERRVRGVEVVA